MTELTDKLNNYSKRFLGFLSSDAFLYIIVSLFVIQALWFALSLAYPLAFDESYHFGVIQAYTHQIGPIIFDQPKSLDYLSDLETQSAVYHYLMSFPLRFIMLFTDNIAVQVIILRLINIAFAASTILVFAKLFKLIRIPKLYVNVGLFFFTMIPVFVYLSGTINYDNLLFLVSAGYFIACVNYLRGDPWRWQNIAAVIALGAFASLVKFTFLPLFAVSLVVFVIRLWSVRRDFLSNLVNSVISLSWQKNTLITLALVATVGMFSATYLRSVVLYGTPQPSCQETLSIERCRASPIVVRGETIQNTKDDRSPDFLSIYVTTWVSNMLKDLSWVIVRAPAESNPRPSSLPIIQNTLYLGGLLAVGLLVYAASRMRWSTSRKFLLLMCITVFASVFLKNASGYFTYYLVIAIQPRYLFIILPILVVLCTYAAGITLRKHHTLATGALLILMLLMTQGGGMTSYLIRSEPGWFWNNATVRVVNKSVKEAARPLIKEYPSKYGF